ncbi:N-acetylglucosamine-6-phosphate deacetylase [soil metagenome]
MATSIYGAHIVSPGLDLPGGHIAIGRDGTITSVDEEGGESSRGSGEDAFDATGLLAVPGFIDIHTHGAAGADVSDGGAGSVATVARAKLREGVTTFLPTTMSLPHEATLDALDRIAAYMASPEPDAAQIPGLHLEGPYLNPRCAGAQNPDFIRPPDLAELRTYFERAPIRLISLAPELPGATEAIALCRERGAVVSLAHTAATHQEVVAAIGAGARHLTHFGNQMSPLHHRAIGALGTGLLDDRLSLEVIADTIHLAPEMLALTFNLKARDQIFVITDSMAASGIGDGSFDLGGLAVTVRDGQARLADGTLAGSTLAMNLGLAHVRAATSLPLREIVATTSLNQARALGLEHLGRIAPGFRADIVLLDDAFRVRAVFVGGQLRHRAG